MYIKTAHGSCFCFCETTLRCRVRRVFYFILISIIKKMWTEWASSSFRTDARLKQRGFVDVVVDVAAAETREDPSSQK